MLKKCTYLLLCAGFFAVPLCWSPAKDFAPGLAVLAGILFAVTAGNPFSAVTEKLTSPLLGTAIAGMGFGMNLTDVLRTGGNGFVYTLIGISLGLGLGILTGKLLRVPKHAAWLVSVSELLFAAEVPLPQPHW